MDLVSDKAIDDDMIKKKCQIGREGRAEGYYIK